MTSQLNVDTIVDKAGSGGTNVKIGNSSTYVSDGGAVTQNTVQGLCKVWADYPGAASSITDSLNIASITDTSAGVSTMNFTNNFSAVAYSCTRGDQLAASSGTGIYYANPFSRATSSCGASHFENGSNADPTNYSAQFTGDLA